MNRLTIMIVEDVSINRELMVNIFENEYNIIEASNGQEGLDILNSGKSVDLIILDLLMPVMNGIEFLERIKSDLRFSQIPVIVNTIQADSENELKAFELGADDFVTKPYNPKTLRRRVDNLIRKYILEKREMEYQLKKTENELVSLVNTVPGGIAVFEVRDKLVMKYYNDSFYKFMDYGESEFGEKVQTDALFFMYKEDKDDFETTLRKISKEAIQNSETKIIRMLKKNGELLWVRISARQVIEEGTFLRYHVVIIDASEEKKTEEKMKESVRQLQYRIDHDMLTGICNRESFYKRTKALLENNKDEKYIISIWNIDRFKVINELYGSDAGDKILKKLADFFKGFYGGKGIYGRLEADHFVTCSTEKFFYQNREEIEELLENGLQEENIDYAISIHVGHYVVEDTSLPIDIMCDRANLAVQSVKSNAIERSGFYNSEMSAVLINEQEMVSHMNVALDEKQYYVVLQPIIDAYTKEVVSAEALVRWKHPQKGIISPALFVPLFEKNGFITKLDLFVREEVCKILIKNKELGLPDIPISINVSRVSFYEKNFCETMVHQIGTYDINPSQIKLEITESAYKDNPTELKNIILKFQKKGFEILMDDFGSGYSSLNMLNEVPVNVLKIDMKFINEMENSDRASDIVCSIIEMAKKLNMETVAEGIETEIQYELLKSMGCDSIQGYYFSKPLSVEEFREYVKKTNRKKVTAARSDKNKYVLEPEQIWYGDEIFKKTLRQMTADKHMGICLLKGLVGDKRYKISFANEKFYETMGIKLKGYDEDYTYSEICVNVDKTDREELLGELKKCKRNKETYVQKIVSVKNNNGKTSVFFSAFVSYDEEYVYYSIFQHDMQYDGDLSKRRYVEFIVDEILKNSKQNLWKYDMINDEITYVSYRNDRPSKLYHIVNAAEYMAKDPWYSEVDKPRIREIHQRLKDGERYISETFYCETDNKKWWNKIVYHNFIMDGQALFAIGVSTDVTDSMEAQEGIWQNVKYREILYRDAFLYAEINLDEDEFLEIHSSNKDIDLSIRSYDSFITDYINEVVLLDERSYIKRMFNRLQLIKWCREGETEIKFDFHIWNKEQEKYEWYSSTMYFVQNEETNKSFAVWIIKNVDAEKRRIDRIVAMAEHDALTGLYNRIAFQKIVESTYETRVSSKVLSAFIMIDIDNFKSINDSFGHEFGDNVLRTIASQIRSNFRKEDSVGRLGGDEFAVFISRVSDRAMVEKKAEELCKKIRITFDNCGEIIQIGCSIGIAFAPESGIDFNSLYSNADDAQYQAKRNGKNKYVVYKQM